MLHGRVTQRTRLSLCRPPLLKCEGVKGIHFDLVPVIYQGDEEHACMVEESFSVIDVRDCR